MSKKKDKSAELWPQKQIPAIENAIVKADKKRAEIEEHEATKKGLTEELKELEKNLRTVIKLHAAECDNQKTEDDLTDIVYEHGEYRAEVKAHERLSYDKVRDTSQGGEE